jgi:ATP-dependent Lon protease
MRTNPHAQRNNGLQAHSALPIGYETVHLDPGVSLVLPQEAASALRKSIVAREAEADEQRRALRLQRMAEEEAEASQARAKAKVLAPTPPTAKSQGNHPEPGFHRVLPDFDVLVADDPTAVGRSADEDVNKRRVRIRDKLIELGPDRRIARSPSWRDALDELEASMPNFRQPIRLLRQSMALGEATGVAMRIPPMLLLGLPGVGKTHFSHRVAKLLGAPHASVQFDQPSAGAQLRGSDKYWSNTEPGLLFNMICLGECANPVVLLDELDKSAGVGGGRDVNPLAQLHAVLEPVTSRRLVDVSVEVEFDASLVTYIATANDARAVGVPILSRLEVFCIEPPTREESFEIAQAVVAQVLQRYRLTDRVQFERKAMCVLAHFSPRLMTRAVEQAAAAAVEQGRAQVGEDAVWAELDRGGHEPGLH